jgi:Cu-processing system permease protein
VTTTLKVLRYELRDVARSRALLLYAGFFLGATELLLRFGGDGSRALLSLSSVTLLVVPLISMVLGTMFVYNAREFNELLLSQPVHRRQLFGGLYLGLALPLAGAFLVGTALPFVIRRGAAGAGPAALAMICITGVFLTGIFTAIAFALALRFEDRVRGMGMALLVWAFFAVAYDALVLVAANAFHAWPLETPLLVMMLLNPVDLARVVLLLNFDVSALMGYTGAVFRQFFGSATGLGIALGALSIWLMAPLAVGLRVFVRKDFG